MGAVYDTSRQLWDTVSWSLSYFVLFLFYWQNLQFLIPVISICMASSWVSSYSMASISCKAKVRSIFAGFWGFQRRSFVHLYYLPTSFFEIPAWPEGFCLVGPSLEQGSRIYHLYCSSNKHFHYHHDDACKESCWVIRIIMKTGLKRKSWSKGVSTWGWIHDEHNFIQHKDKVIGSRRSAVTAQYDTASSQTS